MIQVLQCLFLFLKRVALISWPWCEVRVKFYLIACCPMANGPGCQGKGTEIVVGVGLACGLDEEVAELFVEAAHC